MKSWIVIIFIMLLCVFSKAQDAPLKKYNVGFNNWYFDSREKLYQGLKGQEVDVVFFGNSITERGHWHELFPNIKIANRGIGGDNTYGMKSRIADVMSLNPKKIFLMMGINDIGRGLPIDSIIKNYEEIVQIIKKVNPKTKIYAQSTLPLNESMLSVEYLKGKEDRIRDLNEKIVKLAQRYNFSYVDLKEVLADEYVLKSKYTSDGIHVNTDAYIIWANYLRAKKYL